MGAYTRGASIVIEIRQVRRLCDRKKALKTPHHKDVDDVLPVGLVEQLVGQAVAVVAVLVDVVTLVAFGVRFGV